MNPIVTHLVTSTVFLVVMLLAARLLPLTARTRHAVLLAGLAKFAIPSSAILTPLRAMGLDPDRLFAQRFSLIDIQWVGGAANAAATPAAPASIDWRLIAIAVWIASAALFASIWIIARRRLIASALATSSDASAREHRVLAAARQRLGLRAAIDIRRSTICEAPAVVRIIRPVILLPEYGCDALDDAELESVLRHECAHVARRDNLAGLIESAIVAAFWFNPLVWLAQRAVATAREEACDETAAAAGGEAVDTYVSALTKICRAVLAPRLAGVSCMASAHLKERLRHLMNYESLRHRALSHGFVTTLAAAAVLLVAVAGGLNAAPGNDAQRYRLEWNARAVQSQVVFRGDVIDTESGRIVARPELTFGRGMSATAEHPIDGAAARSLHFVVREKGDTADVEMSVHENGAPVQVSKYAAALQKPYSARDAAGRKYSGSPITMRLRDAEIKDVLNQFAAVTGMKFDYAPSLSGRVTMDVADVPWDQALDIVLAQNGLTYEIRDGAIVIK